MINMISIVSTLEHLSYLGIFLIVAFGGYFLIPEEIILLTLGYVASVGYLNLPAIIVVSIIAIYLGDNLVYLLSRNGDKLIMRLKKQLSEEKIRKYNHVMKNHAGKTIIISRFIFGLRMFSPILAGSNKIAWKKFLLYDLIAITIYTPLMILIGYFFHEKVFGFLTDIAKLKHYLFIFVMIILTIATVLIVRKYYYKKSEQKIFTMKKLKRINRSLHEKW